MLKVLLEVTEQEDNKCSVKMINPNEKSLQKASEPEKNACAMVINQVTKALQEIQD